MPSLAPHISSVPGSGIRRIYEIAVELDDVISLGVGEPDRPVAPHILEAGSRAWLEDRTNYTANGGIPARSARRSWRSSRRENGLAVDVEQVWVTMGATQGLHQAMRLLLAAGDEVLVPDPGYTTFTMNARMLEVEPVPYTLRPGTASCRTSPNSSASSPPRPACSSSTRPRTRSARCFPLSRGLLDFAQRHDLWVLSDEVYEHFTFGRTHVSIASLDDDGRVFSVFSLSKTYAMTGIRVGYLVTPPGWRASCAPCRRQPSAACQTPGQYAAIAAITGDHQHVADSREHYRGNLEAACALLDARGIRYLRPNGAFYLCVDMRHASGGDVAGWAEHFLLERRRDRPGVRRAPGRRLDPHLPGLRSVRA